MTHIKTRTTALRRVLVLKITQVYKTTIMNFLIISRRLEVAKVCSCINLRLRGLKSSKASLSLLLKSWVWRAEPRRRLTESGWRLGTKSSWWLSKSGWRGTKACWWLSKASWRLRWLPKSSWKISKTSLTCWRLCPKVWLLGLKAAFCLLEWIWVLNWRSNTITKRWSLCLHHWSLWLCRLHLNTRLETRLSRLLRLLKAEICISRGWLLRLLKAEICIIWGRLLLLLEANIKTCIIVLLIELWSLLTRSHSIKSCIFSVCIRVLIVHVQYIAHILLWCSCFRNISCDIGSLL